MARAIETADIGGDPTKAPPARRRKAPSEATLPTDGRAARSVRTRESVVEALLDLLHDGNPQPTAREIAERAGVSMRSVYVHFDDLEDLFLAAAARQLVRIEPLLGPLPTDGPVAERIAAFVARQANVLESTGPVRLAAALQVPFSAVIAEVHRQFYEGAIAELDRVFGPELDRLDDPDRRRLLLSLELITSGNAWDSLRADAHLSFADAQALVADHLTVLLSERT